MNQQEIFEIIKYPILGIFACGSRVTCNPPVLTTDEDWMVRVNKDDIEFINLHLEKQGFDLGGSVCIDEKTIWKGSPSRFWSFTKGDLNLLLTCDLGFFDDFYNATFVAKELNILCKQKRVMLFQVILYGNRIPLKPVSFL